jgi:hypothetical protein
MMAGAAHRDRIGMRDAWSSGASREYRDPVVFYGFVGLIGLGLGWALCRSPVFWKLVRGQGVDPSQFGSWLDHLDDDGLGVSWRNDGFGGRRESKVLSRHVRRRS